jgi:S-DNA-T family DNA segregation ATPase FtsK/SpoIIIE
MSGAEKLLGFGDMLFMAAGIKPKRVQGCFVSDPEIEKVTEFLKHEEAPRYDESILSFGASRGGGMGGGNGSSEDDLYNEAIDTVVAAGKASASLLQRRLKVGYARAARLLDLMEENGAIGPADGARPRDVLVSGADLGSYSNSGGGNYVSSYDNTADYVDENEIKKDNGSY